MAPAWLNKLLQRPQAFQRTSANESSAQHSTASIPCDKSMTIDPKISNRLEPSAAPRIFALVIAINRYKDPDIPKLTGCKNDGNRFINFLTGVLGVPQQQIKFLADEEATREEILNQFDKFLLKNTDIQRDDAIILFFAGHGSQFEAPREWVTDSNTTEDLCPHDFRTIRDDGEVVWGIPDRTIDRELRELASEKGDNIVVVLDCCHSGGLARAEGNKLRIRSIPPLPYPPPADLDQKLWTPVLDLSRSAEPVIQKGFRYKAMESHVLLAACRPEESAMEDPNAKDAPGGLFTAALIQCLRSCSLHDTTYSMLLKMMDLKQRNQHPHFEGVNLGRLLFSINTIRDGEITFEVYQKWSRLYVSAGSIHGVTKGTEFTITSSSHTTVLKAKEVGAFDTLLEGSHQGITRGRAVVLRWGTPMLKIHSDSPIQHSSSHIEVVLASSGDNHEPADLAVNQVEVGKWELERFDPLISTYSLGRLARFDASAERLGNILDVIAKFNSHLYRSGGPAPSFAGKVNIRLNRIGIVKGEFNPVGDDLFGVPRSSRSGAELKEAVITDLDARYCFTLENSSDVDLFPYFFYFDPSDYGIQAWYLPRSITTAPLERKSKQSDAPSVFALGYGNFGTEPVEFFLPAGRSSDSGFLKVFLTTTHVDMSNVAQPPITEGLLNTSRGWMNSLRGSWTSETFVLTCRRS